MMWGILTDKDNDELPNKTVTIYSQSGVKLETIEGVKSVKPDVDYKYYCIETESEKIEVYYATVIVRKPKEPSK